MSGALVVGGLMGMLVMVGPAADSEGGRFAPRTRWSVGAAYVGETVAHPGGVAMAEVQAWSNRWYTLAAGLSLGGYVHRRNHRALVVWPELAHRFTARFGLYGELALGLGLVVRWPDGPVFAVGDEGEVSRIRVAGESRLHVPGWLGVGWDLSRNALPPIRVFSRVGALAEYPEHGRVIPRFVLEMGAAFRF